MRWLTAIPAYNEAHNLPGVLARARAHCPEILVVNDGSTDGTGEWLGREAGLHVIHHGRNRGYGAALASAFAYALAEGFDVLVTIDSDGQHDPRQIPELLRALGGGADIASGSRYLRDFAEDTDAPGDRRRINRLLTREINRRYGLSLTDAFCGFKAYRRRALERLCVTEPGWGMPLQVWVQAARLGLRVAEVAVPRVYLDPGRRFGGELDDADRRLAYYRRVLAAAERDPLPALCHCPAPREVPAGMRLCRCGRLIPKTFGPPEEAAAPEARR